MGSHMGNPRANTLSKITLCEEAEVKNCWLLLDPEGLEWSNRTLVVPSCTENEGAQ